MVKRVAYTIDEVADLVGVSRQTVNRAIASGALRPAQFANRLYRVSEAEIERWWKSRGGGELFLREHTLNLPDPPQRWVDEFKKEMKSAFSQSEVRVWTPQEDGTMEHDRVDDATHNRAESTMGISEIKRVCVILKLLSDGWDGFEESIREQTEADARNLARRMSEPPDDV